MSETKPSLAVALSGGGHRATLFTLGALMYLVDAGVNQQVTSIASVSGGSLTNALVGQTLNYRTSDSGDFRKSVVIPLASQIAKKGTFFAPVLTKAYVALLVVSISGFQFNNRMMCLNRNNVYAPNECAHGHYEPEVL